MSWKIATMIYPLWFFDPYPLHVRYFDRLLFAWTHEYSIVLAFPELSPEL